MKKSFFGMVVCALLLSASSALAQGLPDTGQTKCYNNTVEIPCPAPGEPFYGQDAEYVKARSYTDLGNGIVRDNVTGLEWWQADYGIRYTWLRAVSAITGLDSDWCLPTIEELSSLVDAGRSNPAIDPIFNTRAYGYWSSTTSAHYTDTAWSVYFYDGYGSYSNKAVPLYVRAVRGNSLPDNDFINNGDGTITDTSTGLMWQQATTPGTYSWQQALDYVAQLNTEEYLGYDDWRVPDSNELQSIVDYSRFDPAIDPVFSTVALNYWSSTTDANINSSAWCVGFSNGTVIDASKTGNNYVRAVRGGQYVLLGDLCETDDDCDVGSECLEGVCVAAPPECETDDDCTEGEVCVESICEPIPDDPPSLGDGPFAAAGAWPLLSASSESPTVFKQNRSVLWTFSDDFAACSGDCTHTAEYKVLGTETWEPLSVSSDAAQGIAWAALPITGLQNATTYAFRFTVTDCDSQSTQSGEYYFRVATTDAPPVIAGGPWLAAGAWPSLSTSASRAFVLKQNYDVLWTFSDDYAGCAGLCTHRARYKKVEDKSWSWLTPVSTDPTGTSYAYVTLPVTSLGAGTYQFYFDVLDCAGQRTYAPKVYYFKVNKPL